MKILRHAIMNIISRKSSFHLTISETIHYLNKQMLKINNFFSPYSFKMSTQFFSKLSQNFIELLEDDEYYDATIEVGEDPNVKIFRAHMNILCYHSPYLC